VVSFCCLDYVLVCLLEPESRKIFKFDRPPFVKNHYAPDISLGTGDVFKTIENVASYSESLPGYDFSKPQILLSIAWDKYIFVYCGVISQKYGFPFIPVGYYFHNLPLIRMSFIGHSIIFLIDSKKRLKVMNVSLVKPGELTEGLEENEKVFDEFKKADLEDSPPVDPDISFQTYLKEKIEDKVKATYANTVISNGKFVFIISKKDFYVLRLLNWKECLDEMKLKSEWIHALSLGLDIYLG
jgi:hypothetical protein